MQCNAMVWYGMVWYGMYVYNLSTEHSPCPFAQIKVLRRGSKLLASLSWRSTRLSWWVSELLRMVMDPQAAGWLVPSINHARYANDYYSNLDKYKYSSTN